MRTIQVLLAAVLVLEIGDWIAFLIIKPWRWYPPRR